MVQHLTCITGAGFWRVASIGERCRFLTAIGRSRYIVLLHLNMALSSFSYLAIIEVLLQPRGDYALHCVCYSANQSRLLWEIKPVIYQSTKLQQLLILLRLKVLPWGIVFLDFNNNSYHSKKT